MMGTREKLRGGIEYDSLTRFRHRIRLRPGETQRAKRQFWKRIRKRARIEASQKLTDEKITPLIDRDAYF